MFASVDTRSARKLPSASSAISARRVVVAAMRVRHEAFGALRRPLHRPAHLARRPGDDRLLGIVIDLRAEAAAHVGRHDAQLVLRDVQHEGAHQQPDHMRVLAGGVERVVAAVAVEFAHRGARLHRVRDQPVVGEVELHHFRGLGERRIDHRLVADVPVVADVARHIVVHQRRARRDRIAQRRRRRQVLIVDDDLLGRVLRRLLRLGDHHRDRIADMAHLADRDHRMRRLGHRRAVLVVDLPAARQAADVVGRHVGAGIDRDHAWRLRRRRCVDAVDLRMRPVRATDIGIKLAGPVDVVGVVAAAAEEAHVLLAADGGSNSLERHRRPSLLVRLIPRPRPCRASAAMRRRSP